MSKWSCSSDALVLVHMPRYGAGTNVVFSKSWPIGKLRGTGSHPITNLIDNGNKRNNRRKNNSSIHPPTMLFFFKLKKHTSQRCEYMNYTYRHHNLPNKWDLCSVQARAFIGLFLLFAPVFFFETNFELVVLKEQEAKVWDLNGANNTTIIINTYNQYPWCEAYPTHPPCSVYLTKIF